MPRRVHCTTSADREKLRQLILQSGIPKQLFAALVFGVDQFSAQKYLADSGDIPWARLRWLRHIDRVELSGSELHIVLRWDLDPSPYLD